jgi:hypothetical protein
VENCTFDEVVKAYALIVSTTALAFVFAFIAYTLWKDWRKNGRDLQSRRRT